MMLRMRLNCMSRLKHSFTVDWVMRVKFIKTELWRSRKTLPFEALNCLILV
jgi:hypothetical protein